MGRTSPRAVEHRTPYYRIVLAERGDRRLNRRTVDSLGQGRVGANPPGGAAQLRDWSPNQAASFATPCNCRPAGLGVPFRGEADYHARLAARARQQLPPVTFKFDKRSYVLRTDEARPALQVATPWCTCPITGTAAGYCDAPGQALYYDARYAGPPGGLRTADIPYLVYTLEVAPFYPQAARIAGDGRCDDGSR